MNRLYGTARPFELLAQAQTILFCECIPKQSVIPRDEVLISQDGSYQIAKQPKVLF
jgi:hypothetical protein